MKDHSEQLRAAFETHEEQTPDPAMVYARVQELAGRYRRRRWGARAAGGAVLGAGLIAGGVALPGVLPAGPSTGTGLVAPAAAPAGAPPSPSLAPALAVPASPSAAVSPPASEQEAAWDAYFAAGYDYDDAVELAKLWNSKDEIGDVKAEAGRRLLAGERLPIEPDPDTVADATEVARVEAFFAAGYSVEDAVELAELWKTADAYGAKVEGGKRLLAGDSLPIRP
jgi:hypothetical protein